MNALRMKSPRLMLLALLGILLSGAELLAAARIAAFRGDVKVVGADGKETPVTMRNYPLKPGDRVVTAASGAGARIIYEDGSWVDLKPGSRLELEEKGVHLKEGKLKSKITKGSKVLTNFRTPAGVAAVKGTTINIDYDPASGNFDIGCDEGLVSVQNTEAGLQVDLPGGKQVLVKVDPETNTIGVEAVKGDVTAVTKTSRVTVSEGSGVEARSDGEGGETVIATKGEIGVLPKDAPEDAEPVKVAAGEGGVVVSGDGQMQPAGNAPPAGEGGEAGDGDGEGDQGEDDQGEDDGADDEGGADDGGADDEGGADDGGEDDGAADDGAAADAGDDGTGDDGGDLPPPELTDDDVFAGTGDDGTGDDGTGDLGDTEFGIVDDAEETVDNTSQEAAETGTEEQATSDAGDAGDTGGTEEGAGDTEDPTYTFQGAFLAAQIDKDELTDTNDTTWPVQANIGTDGGVLQIDIIESQGGHVENISDAVGSVGHFAINIAPVTDGGGYNGNAVPFVTSAQVELSGAARTVNFDGMHDNLGQFLFYQRDTWGPVDPEGDQPGQFEFTEGGITYEFMQGGYAGIRSSDIRPEQVTPDDGVYIYGSTPGKDENSRTLTVFDEESGGTVDYEGGESALMVNYRNNRFMGLIEAEEEGGPGWDTFVLGSVNSATGELTGRMPAQATQYDDWWSGKGIIWSSENVSGELFGWDHQAIGLTAAGTGSNDSGTWSTPNFNWSTVGGALKDNALSTTAAPTGGDLSFNGYVAGMVMDIAEGAFPDGAQGYVYNNGATGFSLTLGLDSGLVSGSLYTTDSSITADVTFGGASLDDSAFVSTDFFVAVATAGTIDSNPLESYSNFLLAMPEDEALELLDRPWITMGKISLAYQSDGPLLLDPKHSYFVTGLLSAPADVTTALSGETALLYEGPAMGAFDSGSGPVNQLHGTARFKLNFDSGQVLGGGESYIRLCGDIGSIHHLAFSGGTVSTAGMNIPAASINWNGFAVDASSRVVGSFYGAGTQAAFSLGGNFFVQRDRGNSNIDTLTGVYGANKDGELEKTVGSPVSDPNHTFTGSYLATRVNETSGLVGDINGGGHTYTGTLSYSAPSVGKGAVSAGELTFYDYNTPVPHTTGFPDGGAYEEVYNATASDVVNDLSADRNTPDVRYRYDALGEFMIFERMTTSTYNYMSDDYNLNEMGFAGIESGSRPANDRVYHYSSGSHLLGVTDYEDDGPAGDNLYRKDMGQFQMTTNWRNNRVIGVIPGAEEGPSDPLHFPSLAFFGTVNSSGQISGTVFGQTLPADHGGGGGWTNSYPVIWSGSSVQGDLYGHHHQGVGLTLSGTATHALNANTVYEYTGAAAGFAEIAGEETEKFGEASVCTDFTNYGYVAGANIDLSTGTAVGTVLNANHSEFSQVVNVNTGVVSGELKATAGSSSVTDASGAAGAMLGGTETTSAFVDPDCMVALLDGKVNTAATDYTIDSTSSYVITQPLDNFQDRDWVNYGTFSIHSSNGADHHLVAQSDSYWVAGLPTPPAEMPTTGAISYTGSAIGSMITAGGAVSKMTGTCTFTADFAGNNVGGVIDYGSDEITLSGATINQNAISGGTVGWTTHTGVTGQVTGTFYGPDAASLGGNHSVEDDNADRIVGVHLGHAP